MHRDILDDKDDLNAAAGQAQWLVRIPAIVLGLIFSWLQIEQSSIVQFATDDYAYNLMHVALFIYYLAWVFGCTWDISDHQTALAQAPRGDKLPWEGIICAICLTIVFGILCYVKSPVRLSEVLFAFWIINFLSWLYYTKHIIASSIDKSRQIYSSSAYKQFRYERLRVFDKYLRGNWQWYRWLSGGMIIALINIASHSRLSTLIADHFTFSSAYFVIAGLILIFVISMEAWIWLWRFRTRAAFSILKDLEDRFKDLSPRDTNQI